MKNWVLKTEISKFGSLRDSFPFKWGLALFSTEMVLNILPHRKNRGFSLGEGWPPLDRSVVLLWLQKVNNRDNTEDSPGCICSDKVFQLLVSIK